MRQFLKYLLENVESEELIFKKGSRLLTEKQGKPMYYVFGICEGIIAVNKDSSVIDFLGPNQFLGLCVDDDSELVGEILSKKAAVRRFKLQDVLEKVEVNKQALLLLNRYTRKTCDSLMEKIISMKLDTPNRLLFSLRKLAAQFGSDFKDESVKLLPEAFTKKILSTYTGIKPSTLTDALRTLDEDRKIMVSRRVILVYM
ncbi:Crp/Fnr family transcriptional regulator [Listeria booriae]|uniref:Crp/Fnr family transcriptional regulator n=1 Tax=Listeria booriae TaxID=1552123 RepID=A0A842EZ92_9LIST|nr:Crp/Fnr family transcriptional regulator [Listeria booriae]MBC1888840.1 Crp/Fnr family transcriptional regulator [Listeria booriae]MBC2240433.1 Crp/Fnr family transcriptional regulator [Listeria booriae]